MQADVLFILRCCLAVTFLAAAVGKLRNRVGILAVIEEVVPLVRRHRAAGAVVFGALVTLEAGLSAGLLVGIRLRLVAVAATASLVLFAWALLRLRHTGWGEGCACFGVSDTAARIGWVHIARNVVLGGAGGAVFGLAGVSAAEPVWRQAEVSLLGAALAVGVAAALVYGLVEALWQVSSLHGASPSEAATPDST